MRMRIHIAAPLIALSLAAASVAVAQQGEKLGKVEFRNSCSPAVQEKFLRGVAMLHSFYYSATQRAFEDVAAEDNSCAIAAWGYASILMSKPLQGIGASPKSADLAQAAIDKGRKMGAKTQRERDYLEAVAAYYEDFANRPERARPPTRARRWRRYIRRTTRRRSSTRCTSRGRRRRPTRRTPRTSKPPGSLKSSSRSIPTIPGSRTT